MKNKKIEPRDGDIFKIPFDPPYHIYGRILKGANMVFYNYKTNQEETDIDKIISKPNLFIVAASSKAIRDKKWVIIGSRPIEGNIYIPPRFKEAILPEGSPKEYEIVDEDSFSRPATREECIGLEYAFVWSPERIEERLRDHYAGRPNFQAEFYRIKD